MGKIEQTMCKQMTDVKYSKPFNYVKKDLKHL